MSNIAKISNHGSITLVAIAGAILVGFWFPSIGELFKPFGDLFLALISVSIVPIIFSSVTSSVIKLISGKSNNITISRVVRVFTCALIIAGVIGVTCSYVFNPSQSVGKSSYISEKIFENIQNTMMEVSANTPLSDFRSFNFIDFLVTLFPKNPFEAFAKGNVIQILIISIIVGSAVATLSLEKRTTTLRSLSVLASSFRLVLDISTKIFPLGMFFLLSSGFSSISVDVLWAMKDFCISVGISFLVIMFISVIFIWIYSPVGLARSLKALKDPIVVGFSTCSNQATLPFLVGTLTENFKLRSDSVDLAIPLGVTMCRTGNAAYYAFVVVFIAALYNEPLHFTQMAFIVFGSIIASLAASGVSGIISISMLSIILDPLGLPMGSILVVLILVEPILDPFRTVTSLIMNSAISCAVINKDRGRAECS